MNNSQKPTLLMRIPEKTQAPPYNIYERGQIWWWKDPLYGDKMDNSELPKDRGRVAYSRSVLLLQDPTTINSTRCVIVVPLSRSSKSGIEFEFVNNVKTYIHCNSITTVHLDHLIKYMATLSDEIMGAVELGIMKYILPNWYDVISDDRKPNIIYEETTISSQYQEPEPSDDEPPKDPEPQKTNTPIPYKKKETWEPEQKRAFVQRYIEVGIDRVAEEFKLTWKSAQNYYYKWRNEFPPVVAKEIKEIVEEKVPAAIESVVRIPETIGVKAAISKLANNIQTYYQKASVLDQVKGYFRSSKKIFPGTFYDQFGNAIYKSLIKFLGIIDGPGDEFVTPTLNSDTPYLGTWALLDRIFSDPKISSAGGGTHLVKAYRDVFGPDKGIDKDWLPFVKKELEHKTLIQPVGSNHLIKLFEESWCASN